jgi:N utilization substance protein B
MMNMNADWNEFPENGVTYTDSPLTEARLRAIQVVYQVVEMKLPEEAALRQFVSGNLKTIKLDTDLLSQIVQGVSTHHLRYTEAIKPILKEGWPWDRMESVTRCLLLCAVYELLDRPKSPHRVIISEYVTLGKAFFGQKDIGFINGALDNLAKRLRPDEVQG